MSEKAILNIAYQIVQGYNVLYQNNIVHLDIKPDNILVSRGYYKLADFGLSVIQDPSRTVRREGTKTYMSPERLLNPNYVPNALADVYSIGIVLFLIIVGHHPYFSSNAPHLPIKDFIEELLGVPCHIPRSMAHFSLEFQEFFDLVLQMIQRNTLKRVSFEKIYEFVCTSKLFEECRIKEIREAEKFIETLRVSNFVITSVSDIEIQRLDRDVSALEQK